MPRPIRSAYSIPTGAAFGAGRANGTRTHLGCDYHAPVGTPIYGTGDGGVVTFIGYNGSPTLGLGHNISIRYPNGRTVDAHMRERTPLRLGQAVGPNTLVGFVGKTGNAVNASPPGPHDHHQRWDAAGRLINPETYYGASTTPAGSSGTELNGFLMALDDKGQALILKMAQAFDNAGLLDNLPGLGYGKLTVVGNTVFAARTFADVVPGAGYNWLDVILSRVKADSDSVNRKEILAAIAADQSDAVTLSPAQFEALAQRLSIGQNTLAAQVNAVLADDFAKLNANINDQPTTFTISPA